MKGNWWKEAVAYQIYPRSFNDSNGDGIGDLRGITEKLDYLKDLGIDLIWICPMYKSPNDDNGYDISDYQGIMEEFGTMADFDELLAECHARNIKLIIDLVINHTSDEHPWFLESKSSKDSEKRDWYIWKEGKENAEPNNWESIFTGSAWEYDENTEEYFLHIFSKKQPDLNWKNKDVRKALYEMINWWLDKGVDGFRIDAISHINKEKDFMDMPNPKGLKYVSSFDKHMNVKGIHKYLKELKDETFAKYDIVTVGEANGVSSKEAPQWVSEEKGKFNMLFQFEHLSLWESDNHTGFSPLKYKQILSKWQKALDGKGWNALFIENHDITRVVSRWCDEKKYFDLASKAFGLTYFMLKGTPFIYQGQEIGMTNVKFENIDMYDDIHSLNSYKEKLAEGMSEMEAIESVYKHSRDNARTPMQWNDSKYAGFSTKKPWISVNKNYKTINVENQLKDPQSVLNFYKTIIKLKKTSKALIYGTYKLLLPKSKYIFAYERELEGEKYLVVSNLNSKIVKIPSNSLNFTGELVLSNYNENSSVSLAPWECRIYRV
ncbi:MAG: alpha-glucosidase [Fusobacteriaceae bacterium]|nr:alpha-glucosidase [Fusobacteriaceae bacterium]